MTGYAIAGVGTSHAPLWADRSERELRLQAVEAAVADCGMRRREIDGYLATMGPVGDVRFLGLSPQFAAAVDSGGASPASAVLMAIGAIHAGVAQSVLCTFASRVGATSGSIGEVSHPYPSLWGMSGAVMPHALLACRYMHAYGAGEDDLGAVAVQQREHAVDRTESQYYGQAMSMDDYLASPKVVEPFRRLDCCRDANVGAALVVTSEERARDLPAPLVRIAGVGTGENLNSWHDGTAFDRHDDLAGARDKALRQADVTLDDIDVAQLYDPFTISVLMQLEQYGFCGPGEAGDLVRSGAISQKGRIPTNTGGGQLSGWYAIGFTPIVEAVRQLRGDGGPTQVPDARTALVSNHGGSAGVPNTYHHVTMILGSDG